MQRNLFTLLAVAALAALAACQGAEVADVTSMSGDPLDELFGCGKCDRSEVRLVGSGIYEVPVGPEVDSMVRAASVTEVSEVNLRLRDGVLSLDYDLSQRLTGVLQEVDVSGLPPAVGERLTMSGPAGDASCVFGILKGGIEMVCDEELPGIVVDPVAVRAHLSAEGASSAEIAAHLDVSVLFQDDPIGVLTATLERRVRD